MQNPVRQKAPTQNGNVRAVYTGRNHGNCVENVVRTRAPVMSTQMVAPVSRGGKPLQFKQRPAMQLYRPPGLRPGSMASSPGTQKRLSGGSAGMVEMNDPRATTAASKPMSPDAPEFIPNRYVPPHMRSVNGDPTSPSALRRVPSAENLATTPPPRPQFQRSKSSLSSGRSRSPGPAVAIKHKHSKLTARQISDISNLFSSLELTDSPVVQDYFESEFTSTELANQVAQLLVRQSIERSKPAKPIAKLCALLFEGPTGRSFYTGLFQCCQQYLDCKAVLRDEHFPYWLSFVTFLPELFQSLGYVYDGDLVSILFQCYSYMLKKPCLDSLNIEELESVIGCLLNIGCELERECPTHLTTLLENCRDACMAHQEPWARKMLLLLVELSASSWKLPPNANEYYFQAAVTSTM